MGPPVELPVKGRGPEATACVCGLETVVGAVDPWAAMVDGGAVAVVPSGTVLDVVVGASGVVVVLASVSGIVVVPSPMTVLDVVVGPSVLDVVVGGSVLVVVLASVVDVVPGWQLSMSVTVVVLVAVTPSDVQSECTVSVMSPVNAEETVVCAVVEPPPSTNIW